jgi:plastocyanin
VGDTVTWTNDDSTTHTVTADAGAFKSNDLAPGDKFTFTFTTAGAFAYHCSIHPTMTATITVQ